MSLDFEELDYSHTPLGGLSLRRRTHIALGAEVYEVKLGDEFLMSSLFTEGEVALAELALAGAGSAPLDVVVGGLGLGYTARAVLDHAGVRSLLVVEALPEVIDWHRRGLVPLGPELLADARCELLNADFFGLVEARALDPRTHGRRFDAILVDIDHSPRDVLHPAHSGSYVRDGLRRLATQLRPAGAFGLWSNNPPDEAFEEELRHVLPFAHPVESRTCTNTVYVARTAAAAHAEQHESGRRLTPFGDV
jgi:spermidine synthase